VTSFKELRRQMIIQMGSTCSGCGKKFDPSELIIHHINQPLGYNVGKRREVYEWHKTGKLPEGVKLLCDDCNRKEHNYRPSKRRIFGLEGMPDAHRSAAQ